MRGRDDFGMVTRHRQGQKTDEADDDGRAADAEASPCCHRSVMGTQRSRDLSRPTPCRPRSWEVQWMSCQTARPLCPKGAVGRCWISYSY